jgi:hypothetical protein
MAERGETCLNMPAAKRARYLQREERTMTWGIPTDVFLQMHVILSLFGIASGFVVLFGLLGGWLLSGWTALFIVITTLTGITGFPLPPFGIDPARIVGIVLLVLLAAAVAARYAFRLAGAWRWIYVVSAAAALYLNVFVGVTQAFQKLAFLQPLAPTQTEPPFLIAHVAVLVIFVVLGAVAAATFRPYSRPSGASGSPLKTSA